MSSFIMLNVFFCLAAISGAPNLPASKIIHVHSPSWGGANAKVNLEKTVKNALQLADDNNLETVAFPSIGSGQYVSLPTAQTISINKHLTNGRETDMQTDVTRSKSRLYSLTQTLHIHKSGQLISNYVTM